MSDDKSDEARAARAVEVAIREVLRFLGGHLTAA
jgi:hypothetical protein